MKNQWRLQVKSLCSKCNRASGCSDIFGITSCSGYGRVVEVRSDCNGFIEKNVAISTDAEAQQAINLLLKKGYSIEQVQAAWRFLDSNQQEKQMLKNLEVQWNRFSGCKMPPGCVSVMRPSKYGNPFPTANEYRLWLTTDWEPEDLGRFFKGWLKFSVWDDKGIHWDREKLRAQKQVILSHIPSLRKTPVACACPLGADCHRIVLIELANK